MRSFAYDLVLRCLLAASACGLGVAAAADFQTTRIVFESGKSELSPDALAAISALGVFLTETPGAEVKVTGYARTTTDTNAAALAQQRLASIAEGLKLTGVPDPRINLVIENLQTALEGTGQDMVELSAAGAMEATGTKSPAPAVVAEPAVAPPSSPSLTTADKIS